MKNCFLLLLIAVMVSAAIAKEHQPIFLNSIPKSGTHLLKKCLTEIAHLEEIFTGHGVTGEQLLTFFTNLPPNRFLRAHLLYSVEDAVIIDLVNPIAFLIYRDPRDQIVSFAHWLRHDFSHSKAGAIHVSMEQLISDLINKNYIYQQKQWFGINNIKDFYDRFLLWANDPHFCLIRFEHLIGPQGGGSQELQSAEIQKIAHHLGLTLSDDEIKKVGTNLFGGTITFRDGQIGSWKKEFTEQHKQLFKQTAQELLIKLGYEIDDKW